MAQDETTDYASVIAARVPLLDVRAPIEFAAGSLPGAINLPLLDNEQRHLVGECYRAQGQTAAVELGLHLVGGDHRRRLVAAWQGYREDHPDVHVYCARGGMRSAVACRWLEEATGRRPPRLAGGYKAGRAFLLTRLDPARLATQPVVLAGRTGSGKTRLLARVTTSIDLEALAQHRGSSFGGRMCEQPTQADFENRLAAALFIHQCRGYRHLVVEDEGRHVGKRFLPRALSLFLFSGAMILLDVPLAVRVLAIATEYVGEAQHEYQARYGEEDGLACWYRDMDASAVRLAKRLGGARLESIRNKLATAHEHQRRTGDASAHHRWIEQLLQDYYDPMYDYQIDRKREQIVFRGGTDEVLGYLQGLD